MLGEDDVFDSVTWESPPAPQQYDYDHQPAPTSPATAGPGFRQSTDSSEGGPHDPKWEGYLVASVKDPVKELPETKDAYVSYLVSAEVAPSAAALTPSERPQTNLPIFSMLPPGPRAVDIDPPKKKPSFFVDVPTRTPVPRLQLSYQPAQSKLRGFSSINGSQFGMSLANGRPGALSLSQSPTKSVGPDMFLNGASPQFGSGSRRSVKKLVLDKKIEPQDLFHKTGSPSPSPAPKITFDPALSRAAREREYAEETAGRPLELSAPAKQRTTPRFTAAAADDGVAEGEYWTKPDISVLKHKSHAELSAFPNLVVGRAGYGEIHFLDPVDLTGLTRLTDLLGEVVRFDEKECCVYPDVDDDDKPPLGQGLNVRAEISLLHCWALDKATREPIKEPKHPQVVKHVKKLAAMKDTHFVGFDHAEGKWTFTVEHF